MSCEKITLRVYGLLLKSPDLVLVTDEFRFGMQMTKFPGGGLELGEGTRDCLKREFMEELGIAISTHEHFYTTDFYQQSAFSAIPMQLISVYYFVTSGQLSKISTAQHRFAFEHQQEGAQLFRWMSILDSDPSEITFPIDKLVFEKLRNCFKAGGSVASLCKVAF